MLFEEKNYFLDKKALFEYVKILGQFKSSSNCEGSLLITISYEETFTHQLEIGISKNKNVNMKF